VITPNHNFQTKGCVIEVEARFGISKRFLEISAMSGDGPRLVRIGRLVRYRIKDIQHWIEANCTPEVGK